MPHTSSSQQPSLSQTFFEGKCLRAESAHIRKEKVLKPSPAFKQTFPKGCVKEEVSNQLRPSIKPLMENAQRKMLQPSTGLQSSFSRRICIEKCIRPAPGFTTALSSYFLKENVPDRPHAGFICTCLHSHLWLKSIACFSDQVYMQSEFSCGTSSTWPS